MRDEGRGEGWGAYQSQLRGVGDDGDDEDMRLRLRDRPTRDL
jgi:hypothetical protein